MTEITEKKLLRKLGITYYTLIKWLGRSEFAGVRYYFSDYSKHAHKVYIGLDAEKMKLLKKFVATGKRHKCY